ncbi:MAG: indolepyruvate ferredoxin oxidoreductase subunit alpha [Candidatus Stahlbacteria bacterium]|nr:MAG: indolepyruvate ferredoxin oxidoreductase subunit alpha [Candidatus Stahlbacteria bacterium]
MKAVMLGNEAVARGAWEAGLHIAAAYPGTPSSEILESISQYPEIHSEWCTNEKVALEVAIGASFAGARALTAMKHVGLNVAADPLFSLSYIGATGGIVVITADDPNMHSSQNEQDNRHYARAAKIPILEPSDSEEARRFTKLALELSEEFDTPFILRLTTRISHTRTVVNLEEREDIPIKGYKKDFKKRVILPANARKLHYKVEERTKKLKGFSNNFKENRIEEGKSDLGIVTDSISYQYVKEVFPDAWVLKLAMPWPFPDKLAKEFASKVSRLLCIEENDPFIEGQMKELCIKVEGKDKVPTVLELNPTRVAKSFGINFGNPVDVKIDDLPPRSPMLCPGCPHTGFFYNANKLGLVNTGDIGCYTLGALPPLNAIDTCVVMGASVTNAYGIQLALRALGDPDAKKVVGVIGDSTFFHSGITGLINTYYNGGIGTIVILDNSTTAMTGHQGHPGTGKTLMGIPGRKVELTKLIKGIGIEHVYMLDPYDLEKIEKVLKREIERDDISVVIVQGPCALLPDFDRKEYYYVDEDKCTDCKLCLRIGCPAISMDEDYAVIDKYLCTGCSICAQVCPFDAIIQKEDK